MEGALKITPIPHDLDLSASDLVRSPGLHMSAIYGDLYQDLEPKRFVRGGEFNPALVALGTAWERHFEYLLKANGVSFERPGEFTTEEGIAFSPDLFLYVDRFRLGEIKLTSMSSKDMPTKPTTTFPPKISKYMTQMMSYCRALGTHDARLYMLSIYKPHAPVLLAYDIEFSDRELQESWMMMLNHAKRKQML